MPYGDNNNWFAAWAFRQLTLYGHTALRIMNGGRKKWVDEGRPLTTEVPVVARQRYRAAEPDGSVRGLRREVESALGSRQMALVDVRGPQEFTGEVLAPRGLPETCQRDGHIPRAVNIPRGRACNDDGTFKRRDVARGTFLGRWRPGGCAGHGQRLSPRVANAPLAWRALDREVRTSTEFSVLSRELSVARLAPLTGYWHTHD